jgi:hypothetical protein
MHKLLFQGIDVALLLGTSQNPKEGIGSNLDICIEVPLKLPSFIVWEFL